MVICKRYITNLSVLSVLRILDVLYVQCVRKHNVQVMQPHAVLWAGAYQWLLEIHFLGDSIRKISIKMLSLLSHTPSSASFGPHPCSCWPSSNTCWSVLSIFWIRLLIVANTHINSRVCCLLFPELYFVYKMNID